MAFRYGLISLFIVGCATQHKPSYDTVTDFSPDCRNKDAQIRYLSKLKTKPSKDEVTDYKYNQTIDIQIDRLIYYCQ